MENQNLQQSLLETKAKVIYLVKTELADIRHIINGLVGVLRSINTTDYHRCFTIQDYFMFLKLFLMLADTDYRINQLCNGLRKLEPDMSTTYS